MFTNINPLTHRKIEKAFAPVHPSADYALMALRPPHILGVPHLYGSVSSERSRGLDDPSAANDDNFNIDPAFHQYVVTNELDNNPAPSSAPVPPTTPPPPPSSVPPPQLTAEQAMEVDAARALEELAVAGRMEAWHNGPMPHDTPPPSSSGEEFGHHHPPLPPNFHPPFPTAHTPLSANGSLDHTMNHTNHDSDRGSSAEGEGTGGGGPSSYYRDPMSRTAALSAQRSRKRSAGLPVPVPHLTKPSRGRRVPTAGHDSDGEGDGTWSPPSRSGTASPYGTRNGRNVKLPPPNAQPLPPPVIPEGAIPMKPAPPTAADVQAKIQSNVRSYICQVEGCGKAFRRGEHLKRHVRSLHTHEKPERCTFPGCGKEFSRKDNMQQHLKIHSHNRPNGLHGVSKAGGVPKPKDEPSDAAPPAP